MKATVYYLRLTDAERDEVNLVGWNCPAGLTYLNLKDGKLPLTPSLTTLHYEAAAVVEARDAEEVWVALQNVRDSWAVRQDPRITVLTRQPRSMDVGDYLVWDDGRAERCAPIGFEGVE